MNKKLLFFIFTTLLVSASAMARDIRTVTFKVQQMECPNCENKVKKNIRFEKGVKSITTNVGQRTVSIVYDADKTTASRLQAAFRKFKYEAIISPMPQDSISTRTDNK